MRKGEDAVQSSFLSEKSSEEVVEEMERRIRSLVLIVCVVE